MKLKAPTIKVTNSMAVREVGIGDKNAVFRVYIQNTPQFEFACFDAQTVVPLQKGEISACSIQCGNGWRKVFNVYAKLVFAFNCAHLLKPKDLSGRQPINKWQDYRDHILLQKHSSTALIFNGFSAQSIQFADRSIHLIMGRTYAKKLSLADRLTWLTNEFAFDLERRLIVCPYFDYRQLSNAKILYLVDLLQRF